MKVADLLEVIKNLNPEWEVVLARDAEGNSYSLFEGYGFERWKKREGELGEGGKVNCIVLYPR